MSNSTPAQKKIEKLVAEAVASIGPNVESVVIIVTAAGPSTPKGGRTTSMHKNGAGNFYAQYGSVKTWVQRQENEDMTATLNWMRPNQPPDDGESWKNA